MGLSCNNQIAASRMFRQSTRGTEETADSLASRGCFVHVGQTDRYGQFSLPFHANTDFLNVRRIMRSRWPICGEKSSVFHNRPAAK
jgi:hypothetical protein